MTASRALLHVCTTCRAGTDPVDGVPVPGARLHARLAALLAEHTAPVSLLEARCLSTCGHGCAAALAMPGKWTYLLGGLELHHAPDLLAYAATYAASATGVVMPSRRPACLAAVVHGRVPPLPATQ